jgi:SDR family mycofactocin-dependent oxidoreductase
MGSLDGKVAVISGAARGQGRSHAVRLAEEGADIIALDICADVGSVPYPMATREDLEQTVAEVESLDRRIVSSIVDVRDAEATNEAVRAGVDQLGRLDIVVANAGIVSFHPADQLPQQAWQETIDINLTGAWNLASASLRPLIDGGEGGAIVFVSSTAAHIGVANVPHYAATKAGLVGLMQSLAVELGPQRIRVNTVHPTTVNTTMIHNEGMYGLMSGGTATTVDPENPPAAVAEALTSLNTLPVMWVEPVDISNAIVFLAAETGRFVSGTQLRVDAASAAK